jgi:hypothetical protein
MSLKYLENLKKTMDASEWSPTLLTNLLDEMRFFFETLRVQLESQDPSMREAAITEIRELRVFLDKHPVIRAALSQ